MNKISVDYVVPVLCFSLAKKSLRGVKIERKPTVLLLGSAERKRGNTMLV